MRLLPGATREALTLDRQYVGFIPANGDAATLEWRFAPGEPVLRILCSPDRIGVIAIDDLTLFAGEREVWQPRRAGRDPLDRRLRNRGASTANVYALVRPDAWVEPQPSRRSSA